MISSLFDGIKISGIATAVPKNREVVMEKYESVFGAKAVAQFSKSTGVLERRITLKEQTASDLAYKAAEDLLQRKGIEKSDIGIMVLVTQSGDYKVPATACVLHKRLGLSKDCIAFDVNLGCSGYVYGLQIVCSLLKSVNSKYALLLVGDTSNKESISPEDKSACMLFGEGGSATLLEKEEGAPAIRTCYRTDGEGFKAIIVPAGACRKLDASHERTLWGDGNKRSDYDLYMNGVDVFAFSITEVPMTINEFFKETGEEKEDYDAYVFHQANCYILKQVIKRCKLQKEKMPISMDRYGNTSVTSIPLTICDKYGEAEEDRKLKLFTCGFGIGLSWGIASFEVNQKDIYPMIETDEFYEEGEVSHD